MQLASGADYNGVAMRQVTTTLRGGQTLLALQVTLRWVAVRPAGQWFVIGCLAGAFKRVAMSSLERAGIALY